MYQRASQGGGGSTPTVETVDITGGGTKTFSMQNGMFMCRRGTAGNSYAYNSYVSGYVINGEFTKIANATGYDATYSNGVVTVTIASAVQSGSLLYIYKDN